MRVYVTMRAVSSQSLRALRVHRNNTLRQHRVTPRRDVTVPRARRGLPADGRSERGGDT